MTSKHNYVRVDEKKQPHVYYKNTHTHMYHITTMSLHMTPNQTAYEKKRQRI